MGLRVTLIQGGGSGYDQVPAIQAVLSAAGVAIDWEEHLAGWASMENGGEPLPEPLLSSIRKNRLALKTKLLPPPGGKDVLRKEPINYNVRLRRELELFATVRPLKNLPGLPARFQGVDIVIIREITEDLYRSIEHEIVPGVVQSIKVVTRAATERFLRFAFDHALQLGRKRIVCVHKANILKKADGLFLDAFGRIAKEYPQFEARDLIVDNTCMQMVSKPGSFDVLVMGNLYGDLVSDLAAGVVGGVSATHAVNHGDDLRIYDSVHGGTREMIPEGRANPLPLLLPALDLLRDHGAEVAAQRILQAIGTVLQAKQTLTPDLGGKATTLEMAKAISAALP